MNKLIVYTDGGSRGNPGEAAIGIYITDNNNKEINKICKCIGTTTNNIAEYTAVLKAVEWIKENLISSEYGQIEFNLDSSLVVNQLNGNFKIKNIGLKNIIVKIMLLKENIPQKIIFNYIPREKNKIADSLVNKALDFHIFL